MENFGFEFCCIPVDEGPELQTTSDGDKDKKIVELRKKIQEALRAKLDDEVAVSGMNYYRFSLLFTCLNSTTNSIAHGAGIIILR